MMTRRELEYRLKMARDELFDLRCRAGCGPNQEGPDVWQQLAAHKDAVQRMTAYLQSAAQPRPHLPLEAEFYQGYARAINHVRSYWESLR